MPQWRLKCDAYRKQCASWWKEQWKQHRLWIWKCSCICLPSVLKWICSFNCSIQPTKTRSKDCGNDAQRYSLDKPNQVITPLRVGNFTYMPLLVLSSIVHTCSLAKQSWDTLYISDECNIKICDALQEKVTYVGKMNFEFSTKLNSGHPYQHVPEEYKAYYSIELEKRAYKTLILKNVLLRKSHLKFLEDIKTKKNSHLSGA